MSGGHFDYKQFEIRDCQVKLEEYLAKGKFSPDETPAVIEKYRQTVLILQLAHEALHAVDFLICGDTGSDSFLYDWDMDVEPLIKKLVSDVDNS